GVPTEIRTHAVLEMAPHIDRGAAALWRRAGGSTVWRSSALRTRPRTEGARIQRAERQLVQRVHVCTAPTHHVGWVSPESSARKRSGYDGRRGRGMEKIRPRPAV